MRVVLQHLVAEYTRGTVTSSILYHSSNMFYFGSESACTQSVAIVDEAWASFVDGSFGNII